MGNYLSLVQVGIKLVVLNLSQQTDSADLLGGFQPVDPSHALLPLLEHFQVSVDIFCSIEETSSKCFSYSLQSLN